MLIEDLSFGTERETILLAIVVKFCQRISSGGLRTDKYLCSLAAVRMPKRSPAFMKTNFRIGLPSHVTD
jgi:hypothetical protein